MSFFYFYIYIWLFCYRFAITQAETKNNLAQKNHHHKFTFYCDMISEGLRNALNITTVRRKKILSVTPLYPLGVTALLVNKASRDGSAVALPRVPQR